MMQTKAQKLSWLDKNPNEIRKQLVKRWNNVGFNIYHCKRDESLVITASLQFVKVKLTIYRNTDNANAINEFIEKVDYELAEQVKHSNTESTKGINNDKGRKEKIRSPK